MNGIMEVNQIFRVISRCEFDLWFTAYSLTAVDPFPGFRKDLSNMLYVSRCSGLLINWLQVSLEYLVFGVWFHKLLRAAKSPWDPAFPETVLAWDMLLGREDRSRQEGWISWPRTPDFTDNPHQWHLEFLCGKSLGGQSGLKWMGRRLG